MRTNIILYVAPVLNVPGMTEFRLNEETVLGLMPSAGIKRLLGDKLPDPCEKNMLATKRKLT